MKATLSKLFLPGTAKLVLGLGTTCTIGYGTIFYSFSLLSLELEKTFSWSYEFIYGIYSLGVFLTGLFASWFGKAIDEHGARLPMTLGSLIIVVCFFGLSQVTSKLEFVVFLILMEVVSILVLYESAFVALTQATGKQARQSITQITLMAGFASTIFWPLTSWILDFADWRYAYVLMAFLHLFICLPIHWFVLNTKHWSARDQANNAGPAKGSLPLSDTHDRQIEFLIAAAFGVAAFSINGIQIHIFGLLDKLGVAESLAIIAGILIGPFQVISRVMDMILGNKINASILGVISIGLMCIGILFSIAAGYISPYAVFLFAIFFGMGQGLTYIVRGALPLYFFGSQNYGAITGRINRVRLVMTAISPISFAMIMGYLGAVQVLVLLCFLCAMSIGFLISADKRYMRLSIVTQV